MDEQNGSAEATMRPRVRFKMRYSAPPGATIPETLRFDREYSDEDIHALELIWSDKDEPK